MGAARAGGRGLCDAWGGAGAHFSPFRLPNLRSLLSSLKNSLSFLPFFLLCPSSLAASPSLLLSAPALPPALALTLCPSPLSS